MSTLPDPALEASVPWNGTGLPLGQVLLTLNAGVHVRLAFSATLAALWWDAPAAVRHLRWAPIARTRLEASLIGVPDAMLDGQPFPGEWSVRQQLAHVELTDVRYTIATQYAVRRVVGGRSSLYLPHVLAPTDWRILRLNSRLWA